MEKVEITIVTIFAIAVFAGFLYAIFKDRGNNHPGTNSSNEEVVMDDINA